MTTIPGPKPLPLLGNLTSVLAANAQTNVDFAREYHEKYGPIFAMTLAGQRMIFASGHALVAEMCGDPGWSKSVHATLAEVRAFAGDGLFTAHNDEPNWATAHRLLMPAFGPLAMKDHFPAMLDIADQMFTRWARFGPEAVIDVGDDMTRLTLDTIALAAFGLRLNSFYSEQTHPFVGAMTRSLVEAGARSERLPAVQALMLGTNRRYRTDIATMREITERIVADRIAQPAEDRPADLLERMLTTDGLPAENIQYQLATFLIAGHETTSGLLTFATHELLAHPELLRRARRAVDEVLGDRLPTFEDLTGLGYLGQILRETLRLHPTAPAFALKPDQNRTLGGYEVSADEDVLVMLPVLHRDPAVWDDPDTFDPDRFAPDRMAQIPEYAWMPFGHGARACIGRSFALQEATVVLAMMLQRFDLQRCDPDYELHIQETLTIKPKDLTVRATPRTPRPVTTVTPQIAQAAGDRPMLVLYGSNGGSSESLARTIAADSAGRGFAATVAPLDEHTDDLPVDGPVVIVTASYNGNPPDNAARFVTWLTTTKPDLTGIEYLVLGCGSLDWAATYQKIPTLIDEAMAAAGAHRLRDRGVIDARTDFFGDWERWYEGLWPLLAPGCSPAPAGPRFRVSSQAVVLENRELVTRPGHGSKRHLEIRLPGGGTYRTGDYLSILPENDPALVSRMLDRLGLRPGTLHTIASDTPQTPIPIGHPVTAEELLSRYVDLTVPATLGVVARLAGTTRCTPERAELDQPGPLLENRLTLLDLLERFTSCRVELALVLELLPAPRPRLYSISSAAEQQPEVAALTVSVVDGGTASGHLSRSRPGDPLTVTVRSPAETFRPPADPSTPILMIAAGTGIAPFRGFLHARPASAPAVLFFGCRHPDADDLYATELTGHEVHRAYSRRPDGDIRHVQHRLWEQRDRVLALVAEGAHVYVCGDAHGMGPAVEDTLRRIGGDTWLDDLRTAGRYATDIY